MDSPGSAIGIDLGGTKIAAARVDADGRITGRREIPTPRDESELALAPIELAIGLIDDEVVAIGMGAAGLVRWPEGTLVWGPNVVVGEEIPFRRLLEEAFGVPAVVDNDANVAGLAEARLGAGRSLRHMVMVTLGTGIGGAVVIDSQIYRGASFAGEFGHMIVQPGGPACGCGLSGCWEALASGSALDRMAQRARVEDPDGEVVRLAGGGDVDGEHVTRAAAAGDPYALGLVGELAGWVALGLANLIEVLDPEAIVIGGGLGGVGDLLLDPTRRALPRLIEGSEHRPATPIRGAALGGEAGIVGAALLGREGVT